MGVTIVAGLGVAVWWTPGSSSFVLFPPLVLGLGVGFVDRFTTSVAGDESVGEFQTP